MTLSHPINGVNAGMILKDSHQLMKHGLGELAFMSSWTCVAISEFKREHRLRLH
jgi:hypothetical protein